METFLTYISSPYIWGPRIMIVLLGLLTYTGYLTIIGIFDLRKKEREATKEFKIWKLWLYFGAGASLHLMLAIGIAGLYPFSYETIMEKHTFWEAMPLYWLFN